MKVEDSQRNIVVLGLGNVLLGDEGLGVRALHLLETRFPDSQIQFYDGGTRGLMLLPFVEDASHLLIFDAVQEVGPAGKIVELDTESLSGYSPLKFSAHDIGLPDLLALLQFRNRAPAKIKLLGLVPDRLNLTTELSEDVNAALTQLLDKAESALRNWMNEV
jgi:hydrogenase maturation protease